IEYISATSIQKLALPNDVEWAKEQRKDKHLNAVIRWIEEGTLPDDDKWAKKIASSAELYTTKSESGILYRVSKVDPEDSDVTYRRCVPKTWRKLILAEFHDSLWSGAHL